METMKEVVVLGIGLVQILPRAHGQGEMKPGSAAAAAAVGLRQAICSTFPAAAAAVAGAVVATLIGKQNGSLYGCYGTYYIKMQQHSLHAHLPIQEITNYRIFR
jgi:hypothetical protein